MTTLRFFDLQKYLDKYRVTHFIETGTYEGASLSFATEFGFEDYWSIEYWEPFFRNVYPKFMFMENVHILKGHSPLVLREILQNLDMRPCLFWLDAHFPGYSMVGIFENRGFTQDVIVPLQDELKVISELREGKDVILIDDLCLFENGTDGGNCETLYNLDLSNLKSSHDINRYMSTSGYLEMLPKKR